MLSHTAPIAHVADCSQHTIILPSTDGLSLPQGSTQFAITLHSLLHSIHVVMAAQDIGASHSACFYCKLLGNSSRSGAGLALITPVDASALPHRLQPLQRQVAPRVTVLLNVNTGLNCLVSSLASTAFKDNAQGRRGLASASSADHSLASILDDVPSSRR